MASKRSERVERMLASMSRDEKLAQLVGLWVGYDPGSGGLATHHDPWTGSTEEPAPAATRVGDGVGELTRPLGTAPVDAAVGARAVRDLQEFLERHTRPGVPAIVHEECLTGLMALGATVFPSPLNWGSTWDPGLVEEVGAAIRAQMRAVGAHQGLAPVLDVVRDPRWGRVEECIGEDPYLVGVLGVAYIRGLQGRDLRTGVAATAKHLAGHSFSEGGRNLAPAHVGPREMADVFLLPFEMAVVEGGVRSVMNAYHDNDGVPAAASHELLTGVLRDTWGFDGVVVSDYFSIDWLHLLHATAGSKREAASMALRAGVDVELPSADCYLAPLAEALGAGEVAWSDVDRAVGRVLRLKEELGLLPRGSPAVGTASPDETAGAPAGKVDLDPPAHRALSRRVAESSIVLLKNDGTLPIHRGTRRLAVIGPNADSRTAVLGNYCFDNHVASHLEDPPPGVPVVTVAQGIRELAGEGCAVDVVRGCDVASRDTAGFEAAVSSAAAAEVAIVVVGDQAGHFGSGTSGEGTDVDDLHLPGVQEALVEAVAAAGTPTVVVLVSGRPYELGRVARVAAAVVASWFPGEEAGNAVAAAVLGLANPGGKTPVTFGRGAGQQPQFYNDRRLGRAGYSGSTTRPVYCFGHGLSYTSFAFEELVLERDDVPVQGTLRLSFALANTGGVPGEEVAQVYVSDLAAEVTRPALELKAFCRVHLDASERVMLHFDLPADLLSFTGLDMTRVVEPGEVDVMVGSSSQDVRLRARARLTGERREVGPRRALLARCEVERL